MSITLGNLKEIINDIRADDTNSTVDIDQEGYRAINFILNDLQNAHDWEGGMDEYAINYYSDQKQYALPTDFKALISLLPASNFTDDFKMRTPSVFIRRLTLGEPYPMISIEEGTHKRLGIHYPYTRARKTVFLSNASYDGNGTWTAGDDASNVRTDNVHFTENNGSVEYDVAVAGSVNNYSTLTTTMTSAFDMTGYETAGLSFNFTIPNSITTPEYITGIELRFGTDASNYFTQSVTSQADGTSFVKGINYLMFDLENATETGTVTTTNIAYCRLKITHNALMSDTVGFRFGEMRLSNYEPMVLRYYTNKLVYDVSAGTRVVKFDGTDDTDYLLLPEDSDIVIETGASWRLLDQMEETDKAEKEHNAYIDRRKNLMDHYPSKRKRPDAPSLGLGWPSLRLHSGHP